MLTIRLQRIGKRNSPSFRVVVAEKESHVTKKITEALGNYDPKTKDFKVKEDRVKYWLGQHINLSPTIHNLFVSKGLLEAKKVKAFSTPKKPVEPAAPAAVPAATETPAEVAEATAEVESKVSEPETTTAETPKAEAPATEPAVEKPADEPKSPEQVQANPEQV